MAQTAKQSRPAVELDVLTPAEEAQMRGEEAGAAAAAPAVPTVDAGADTSTPPPAAAPKAADAAGTETPSERPAADARAGEARTVPLVALQEERERRKELQKQVEETSRRADERLALILQKFSGPQPQPQPAKPQPPAPREIPDPAQDALGAIRMTAEEVKVLSDFKRHIETTAASEAEAQAVIGQATALEADYERVAPDYRLASNFVAQSRVSELRALGLDPVRIQQTMRREAADLAAAALKQGRNPAEIVYTLAKSRGYQRQSTPAEHQQISRYAADQETAFKARVSDYGEAMTFLADSRAAEYRELGHAEADVQRLIARDVETIARQAHAGQKNPAEIAYNIAKQRGYRPHAQSGDAGGAQHLDRVRRGQQAGTSLGAAAGSSRGKTGIEALLSMTDADFARALDKMNPAQMRESFGN